MVPGIGAAGCVVGLGPARTGVARVLCRHRRGAVNVDALEPRVIDRAPTITASGSTRSFIIITDVGGGQLVPEHVG